MMLSSHKSVQAFLDYVHAERERAVAVAEIITGRINALAKADPAGTVVSLSGKGRKAELA